MVAHVTYCQLGFMIDLRTYIPIDAIKKENSQPLTKPNTLLVAGTVLQPVRLAGSFYCWFVLLLVREEVLLAGLCKRKILFRLKIYDHSRQATAR